MSQLIQLIVYESRLYYRSKLVWLMGVLIVLTSMIPTVSILLKQYLIINIMMRDQTTGFFPIHDSLSNQELLLSSARGIAIFFLLLGFWPLMLAMIAIIPEAPEAWLGNGQVLTQLTLKYIVSNMTSIGIVFLCSMVTRNIWKLGFLVSSWWIIGVLWWSNQSKIPSWSMLFLLGDGIMTPRSPSIAVGYFLQQNLLPYFAAFQGSIAIVFFIVAIIYQMVKRGEYFAKSKILIAVLLGTIMIAYFSGVSVWQEVQCREKDFFLAVREMEQIEKVNQQSTPQATLAMEAYQLTVQLQTINHYLEGAATIKAKLENRSSDIAYFTLRNCFAVKEVADSQTGEPLEWWQEGSRLAIRIPAHYQQGDSLALSIIYSGQVWEWFTGATTRPNGPVNFIDSSLSLLRSGYAWYPIAGDYPLYTRVDYSKTNQWLPDFTIWAKRALHSPLPFQLTVDIDDDNTVASNLEQIGIERITGKYKYRYRFSASQGKDVFLMTGPYHYEKRNFLNQGKFVEVYSYHQHQSKVDYVVNNIATPYLFYNDMLVSRHDESFSEVSSDKTCTIIEVPSMFSLNGEDSDVTLANTVVVEDLGFQSPLLSLLVALGFVKPSTSHFELAALRSWGQDRTVSGYCSNGNIVDGLGLFLHAIYNETTYGCAYYEQVKQNVLTDDGIGMEGIPSLLKGPVVREVFMILDTIRSIKSGDVAIKKIVSEGYQICIAKNKIDATDFTQIVEGVLVSIDCPQEKVDEIHNRLGNITLYTNESDYNKIERFINFYFLVF